MKFLVIKFLRKETNFGISIFFKLRKNIILNLSHFHFSFEQFSNVQRLKLMCVLRDTNHLGRDHTSSIIITDYDI